MASDLIARHRKQSPSQCETLPQAFVNFWIAEACERVNFAEIAGAFCGELPLLGVYGWAAMRGYLEARRVAEEDQRKKDAEAQLQQKLNKTMGRR